MVLEKRLLGRHQQLVRSHMVSSDLLSAGVKSTLNASYAFSQTQAAWRFFNNERCELNELMKPILEASLEQSKALCVNYALVAHDWSGLAYKLHHSKADRFGIHNSQELGYELQSSLLISDIHGGPIAPIAMNLATKTNVLSTYRKDNAIEETHLEELAKRVDHIEKIGFEKPLIHIVDREGDSAQLMRVLKNRKWILRARCNSCVEYNKSSIRVDKLAEQLVFTESREVNYKGKKVEQHLAEVEIFITRPSKAKKKGDVKKIKIKGDAVPASLIVSKIQDSQGKVLAWWYLLTNADDVYMADIGLWYYWRWSIESFFKLLKSAGMHLEQWQQESGEAIARRLLVACMACVFVWQIAEAKGAEAGELRKLLIRLSGRQMKYGIDFTRPALLAGLSSLLNTLDLLNHYSVEALKDLLRKSIGDGLV